ncbi:MAG: PEP-CTERM/exosortase system-associated acyltransferase [Methylovulum sp.]|uniref:PEP-CTERM/exosortase system-associated acyltransferase n=1 Tax=Methylovulum sp. TaxID=1916980 RepID=UPI002634302F|nr:PEP-CTERM/exosortase system-associated acyltransferase [Methylovulum sp.]MDD2723196.1 PEP-CTERM/exosortase system-associated acyltransferase [Methylovulum sp.]MDD5123137.1 PEP-CTERM/exosortase system-associated acyltransferase [Methylovulum sp.]
MIDAFNQYFEMVPAISKELKNEVYKLRYQVYCFEMGVFSPDDYPDKMEYDEFDQHSVHYLIRHRSSGDYAATTRLVLPNVTFPEELFPIEVNCEIDNTALMQQINRANLAEASRFCISKAFKRRKNESNTLVAINEGVCENREYFSLLERRALPHMSFALITCLIKSCYEHNIEYLFGTLEPAWFRFLSSAGVHFIKIGPLLDYHGERWPCIIKIEELVENIANENQQLWGMLTEKGNY